jgi:hypothetical protein
VLRVVGGLVTAAVGIAVFVLGLVLAVAVAAGRLAPASGGTARLALLLGLTATVVGSTSIALDNARRRAPPT